MDQNGITPFGVASSRASHRLFFALWPTAEVRERIDAVARDLRAGAAPAGRWIKPQRYHLTLPYLGEHATLPDALVDAACAAGDRVRAPPFEFVLDRAGSFANRKIPWWLGSAEVDRRLLALWAEISAALRDVHAGFTDDAARRVPHVTILRDADRVLAPTPIAPIEWPVAEFVLIDSLLATQAHYAILRRWLLRT